MKKMKNVYKYIMVAALMVLLPAVGYAAHGAFEFQNKQNFKVSYDPSSFTYSFDLMVHANGSTWNGWVSTVYHDPSNRGKLQISIDGGANWDTIAEFWGDNYDKQTAGAAEGVYVKVLSSDYGNISTSPYSGERYGGTDSCVPDSDGVYLCYGEWYSVNSSYCTNAVKAKFSLAADVSKMSGKTVMFRVLVKPVVLAISSGYPGGTTYTHDIYTGTVDDHLTKPTLVAPYLDFSASANNAGRLVFHYSLGQKAKSATIHVGSMSYNIPNTSETTEGSYAIDPIEDRTNANIEATYEVTSGADGSKTTTSQITRTSESVDVQPYKSISKFHLKRNYLEDQTLTPLSRYGSNTITWEMKKPTADLYNMDQFVILRGYKSDYSDLESIGSVGFNDYQLDDNDRAVYTYTDEASEATAFNTEESAKPDSVPGLAKPRIYYAVARATAYGIWGLNATDYVRTGYLDKQHGLPDVTRLTTVKEDSLLYPANHRVKIRVEMADHSEYFTHCIWHSSASIIVQRRNVLGGVGDKDITISGDEVKWDADKCVYYAETTDEIEYEQNEFTYAAIVKNDNKYLRCNPDPVRCITESDTKLLVYSLAADMKILYATTNEYDQITVTWPSLSGLVTTGKLERREVKGANDETAVSGDAGKWNAVSGFNWQGGQYVDKDIKIGHFYQYRETLSYTNDGMTTTCVTEKCPIGFCNTFGKITGRLSTKNGMGLAGVKVQITPKTASSAKTYTVYTDDTGSYSQDSIEIVGEVTTYTVQPTSNGKVQYCYAATGMVGGTDIELGNGKSYYSGVDFYPENDLRINGRVLFDGTTVPVAHANFKLNGKPLYQSAGSLVETDGSGNFSFTLPSGTHIDSLQVVKVGHTFKLNGKIKNQKEATSFDLDDNIEAIQLHDMTKTRLAGRIVGGYVQQAKPMGFGLTKNNIGDSITVIMQLEGDNTAYLVYDDNDVSVKERKDTAVSLMNDTTITKVERKRMTIHANEKTGEFYVDLLPVKYKISAISAKGYGSLFNKGMVSQVIDMTDSLECHQYEYTDTTKGKKYTAAYNNAFNYAYHSGIKVSYVQMQTANYGEMGYLGEQMVKYTDIDNTQKDLTLAEKDTAGVYSYNLTYPLFVEGKTYNIKGKAHEDYYYNNDKTTSNVDIVPVTMGTMVIDNGLTAKETTSKYSLDSNGECLTTFVAGNQLFTQTGEKALAEMNMSLDIDGYYYEAEPLKAFVTGTRSQTTGTMVEMTDSLANIQLLDILRDPPGSKSSASIAAGTTWNMSYNLNISGSASLNISLKKGTGADSFVGTVSAPEGAGIVSGYNFSASSETYLEIPIPIYNGKYSKSYSLSLNTNETISTSSDATDCGAMSDIFIGATQNMKYSTTDVISVIDEAAYQRLLPAISANAVTVIQKGKQADGSNVYLVRAETLMAGASYPVLFTYSQRHIYEYILPNLFKQRSALVKKMSAADAQTLANSSNSIVYYTDRDDWEMAEDTKTDTTAYYHMAIPKNSKMAMDQVANYTRIIKQWILMLMHNEVEKVDAFKNLQKYKTVYSISSGVTRTFKQDESDTGSDSSMPYYASMSASKALSTAAKTATSTLNTVIKNLSKKLKKVFSQGEDDSKELSKMLEKLQNLTKSGLTNAPTADNLITSATTFTLKFTPSIDVSFDESKTSDSKTTRSRSYTLGVGDDSYMDIEVYKARVDTTLEDYESMKKAFEYCYGSSTDNNVFLNNYIFREVGGATRNPWQDADSTVWYINESTGMSYPLAARTLKIDNPVLVINEPEVNNVLPSDKAYFTIRMSNESELGAGIQLTKSSTMTLSVVPGTNPHGAEIFIDGNPIGTGLTFSIAPNTQLTKTMTVSRGQGFDFENIQLMLSVSGASSTQYFSIHYVPSSSPVTISSPGDKWVMNTLSSKDDDGYYLPLTIEGFDVNRAGFDHIEIQYKKHTEGTIGWTNLCSYFANDSIYQKANGTKKMIKTGRITDFRFYGEKDPVEMEYDIRAVTYSRNGSEFITNSSDIITGTKDTRAPQVFGNPKPEDGILTYTDNIELPFTEPIAYNYLDETGNFTIEGYTNNTKINQGRSLYFPGTSDQSAKTEIDRNLSNRSFSVDMMVKPDDEKTEMTFFSHKVGGSTTMAFGITADQYLFATFNGTTVKSTEKVVGASQSMHSAGVVCEKLSDGMKVSFFYGNELIDGDKTLSKAYTGVGPVYLGTNAVSPQTAPFKGNMLNVRLWNKALNASEITQMEDVLLNGYQSMLKDYWPLTETSGSTAADKVSGATLHLNGTTWASTDKFSLKLKGEAVAFESEAISMSKTRDYSLGFWFRTANGYTPDDSKYVNVFGVGTDDNPQAESGGMRIGFTGGNFVLRTGGKEYVLATTAAMADTKWHYYMMSISPSMSTANIYIDNNLIIKPYTDQLDGVATSGAMFGGNGFCGNVDMFTQWQLALSKSYMSDISGRLLTGKEDGLHVYMPFTTQKKSDQSLYHPEFSPYNEIVEETQNSAGETVIKSKTLMLTEYSAANNIDTMFFAPMASAQEFKKIPFKWSSTSTSLMINLNIPDNEIDKQNIHIQIRDVEDLNGNPMANPLSWTVYPDLSRLRWDSSYMSYSKAYGVTESKELTWSNTSGKSINYSVTTTSSHIKIGTESGVASANSTNAVTITMDGEMPVGEYDEFIYINDLDNELTEPLRIRFNVEAKEPEWTVTTSQDYNQTMSVVATVRKKDTEGNWYIDTDTKDVVGAFIGDECVGKAYITFDEDSQESGIYMTVHGKTFTDASGNIVKKHVTFRLWDATTNVVSRLAIYESDTETQDTCFAKNAILGIPTALDMRTTNYQYQYIDLAQGWNWVSFNVKPNVAADGPNNFFRCNAGFSQGDIFSLSGTNMFYSYNEKTGTWEGNNTSEEYNSNNVYQIYVNKAVTAIVNGEDYTESDRLVAISVTKGNWTQLAYLLDETQPMATALSDFAIGDKCSEGSVIKSYDAFAVATGNKWVGSLKYMDPGKGYYLRSNSTINTTIRYTNNTVSGAKMDAFDGDVSSASSNSSLSGISSFSSSREHNGSMPVIATFADGSASAGDVLVAYFKGEVVGVAEYDTENNLFFLSVNAENGNAIKFAKVRSGEVEAVASSTVDYQSNAVVGSLAKPYEIDFNTTGINGLSADDDTNVDSYDIIGRKYREYDNVHKPKGVYIINGKKIAR